MQVRSAWNVLSKISGHPTTWLKIQMSTTTTQLLDDTKLLQKKSDGKNAKPFEDIPGPKSNPAIHLLKYFMPIIGKYTILERYKYFEEIYQTYGSIAKETDITGTNIVHLFDPKDIENVFRATIHSSIRPPLTALNVMRLKRPDIYEQPGLFALNGEEWRRLRQKFQVPMLQANSAELYCGAMDNVAQDFVERLDRIKDVKGEVQNLLNELYKWALESIGLVIFNKRLGCLEDGLSPKSETMSIVKAVQDTFASLNKLEASFHLYRWFPTPTYKKLEAAQVTVARLAKKYINSTLQRIKDLPEDSTEKNMILVKLLSTEGTTFGDVIVMINDLLLAGVDTTSHSTVMTLYHLGRNPNAQDKLATEIKNVLRGSESPMTSECLQNLRYLRACVKESMRMSPIVDGNARFLDKDLIVSGYKIPAGTMAVMHGRIIGQKLFENANQFLPERWMKDGAQELGGHHPYAMLPFGFGPRMCLGRRFAEQEIYLLLTRLIKRYEVKCNDGDIEMVSRLVNVPDKVPKINFIPRST